MEADVCAWRAKVQRTVADGGAARAAADRAAAVAALSAALAAVEATKDPWAEAREPATAEYAVIKRTWNVAKGFSYGRTFRLAEGGAIETRDADGRLTNRYEAHRVLGVEALNSRPTDFVLRLAAAAGAFCAGEEHHLLGRDAVGARRPPRRRDGARGVLRRLEVATARPGGDLGGAVLGWVMGWQPPEEGWRRTRARPRARARASGRGKMREGGRGWPLALYQNFRV